MTSRTLRHGAALLGFLFALTIALATPVKFDIPSQPAASAIKAFIKQSKAQVAYRSEELEGLKANEVKGEFEPDAALTALLKDTGCAITRRDSGIFVVTKAVAPVTTGSVRGVLTGEGGKGMPNVLISIRETAESAETNRFGEYVFPKVAAGTYVLVASAPGYQTMHIADVQIRAGRELTIGKEEMRKAKEGPLALEPFVVKADTVTELDPYEVTGSKVKPFSTANVDIPRTINDAQPRYIFDAKTIDQSGATNIEDFLKQRLTMNATFLTNSQNPTGFSGNTSAINLRGLGTNKTLILVNGRRMAGVSLQGSEAQPDINGIPMSFIERVEVLPSSASGIYGGGAIGGVVNIVLKNHYRGGELRATYDNTWNTDSPKRTASLSYGAVLEGGKTRLMLTAQWSDAEVLLLRDRRELLERGVSLVMQNAPTVFSSALAPFLGATPNITRVTGTPTLTLKPQFGGTTLSSNVVSIPVGTSPNISPLALGALLHQNSGIINTTLPETAQSPTGLSRAIGVAPVGRSLGASLRRHFTPHLEAFTEFRYDSNHSDAITNNFRLLTISPASPVSPFTNVVRVSVPDAGRSPITSDSVNRTLTVGLVATLPRDWTLEFDYTWSANRYSYTNYNVATDDLALSTEIASGAINPFADTLQYPLDLTRFAIPQTGTAVSNLDAFTLRGNGPVFHLPWGVPNLTFGLERRMTNIPGNTFDRIPPISTSQSVRTTYFKRHQTTDSAYAEASVPLVKRETWPLLYSLDLQASGRSERYTTDTGTPSATTVLATGITTYADPTLNGQPYFSEASFVSNNYTVGFKYQPVSSVILRASSASAFLPPTPAQLVRNPVPNTNPQTITDPRSNNANYSVQTISGGNPDLVPQNSKSLNLGVVWQPTSGWIDGLRINAEYFKIEQFDAISTLSPQSIINDEASFGGRVTRNASNLITLVDVSALNLFHRETEGWDWGVDYERSTSLGTFAFHAIQSRLLHLKNQYSRTSPEFDAVNFPSEEGAVKNKTNATLSWSNRGWTAGWTTRYFGSYKQRGAAGGPSSVQSANGGVAGTTVAAQGSDSIPSQTYHDLFFGYSFEKVHRGQSRPARIASSALSNLTIQAGVRNLFGTLPPFDANYDVNFYISPYGDIALRSYWVSVRKSF